jgi:hypothetical protein
VWDAACRAAFPIASRLMSTSVSVLAQLDTLILIAVRPCQTVASHQQTPTA